MLCGKRTHRLLYRLRSLIIVVLAVNIYVIFRLTVLNESCSVAKQLSSVYVSESFRATNVAFVILDFEDFENDIINTVSNLSSAGADILIVSDQRPYPPLALPKTKGIHLAVTNTELGSSVMSSRPEIYVVASYVFLVPDGIRMVGNLQNAINFLSEVSAVDHSISMVAFPVETSNLLCLDLHVDSKRWTLEYKTAENDTVCDAVDNEQFVLLMSKETFLSLPSPFLRPFKKAIFIQTAYRGLRVIIDEQRILSLHTAVLYKDSHIRWKHARAEKARLRRAYEQLGFKMIKQVNGQQEWFGCSKDTSRCFGTVIDDMPEYIYQGRWTPPCCLRALRETARHVFKKLESDQVRYWLEGGSLLGAARTGDIIPWDYDIDIGIYRDDVRRCKHLSDVHYTGLTVVDDDGFVWEKATEGDFYRVQYSQSNHLHVDIFPFYSRNGTMTKDTWFKTHRQDTEFPESFIQPLQKINFIGLNASGPNDVRRFLEFKFGVGMIENPRYPNTENVM